MQVIGIQFFILGFYNHFYFSNSNCNIPTSNFVFFFKDFYLPLQFKKKKIPVLRFPQYLGSWGYGSFLMALIFKQPPPPFSRQYVDFLNLSTLLRTYRCPSFNGMSG